MVNLNRVYSLIYNKEDVTKESASSILFQISPANNKSFVRAVKIFRKTKNYRIKMFKIKSKALKVLMRRYSETKNKASAGHLIPPKPPDALSKQGRKLEAWIDSIAGEKEITKLRQQFDIPSEWHYPIRDYIVTGRMPKRSFSSRIIYTRRPMYDDEMWLEIYGNTTLKGILEKQSWSLIEAYQQNFHVEGKTWKRFRKHIPLTAKIENGKILLSIYPDTNQATVKKYWKKLHILKLQQRIIGRSTKGRKGLGLTSLKLLRGQKDIPNPESVRTYRHRLRKRGLME